ncbi:MAG: hypothetical protein ACK463_11365, partial [Bradyrhizobium sp.]
MWTMPPTDSVLHVLSFIAVAAQSMTAALAAGRRSMDWAGVCMLRRPAASAAVIDCAATAMNESTCSTESVGGMVHIEKASW